MSGRSRRAPKGNSRGRLIKLEAGGGNSFRRPFVLRLPGEFERVRAGAIEVDLFGQRCRVISLDDLIRAKEALGREKDLLSVKELKAIREKQAKS